MTEILLSELADYADQHISRTAADRVMAAGLQLPRLALRDLVRVLAPEAGLDEDELLRRFGRRLFARFATLYPAFFVGVRSARDLLLEVAPRVHGNLHHLQPAADFPVLDCSASSGTRIAVEYRSGRDLGALAEGLLRGCCDYFGSTAVIRREDLCPSEGYACRFIIDEGSVSPTRDAR